MKNILNFIKHVEDVCVSQNIKLVLYPKREYYESTGILSDKLLVVCIDYPLDVWLSTLVHEYGHLEQDINGAHQISSDIFTWLKHKKKHSSTLYKLRDMELDCERRSLKNIDRFKLPLKKSEYAKKAAAYIHYYNYMLINPVWPKIPPSSIDEIVNVMPNSLRGNFQKLGKYESIYRKNYDF